jgi:type IV pilus assembly protein PilB
VLPVTDPIESMVIARRATNEIKQQGIAEGMSTLRDDGWNKVSGGVTTIEEVLRVTEDNE